MNFVKQQVLCLYFVMGLFLCAASTALGLAVPNPVLVFNGQERFLKDGKQLIRYNYFVFNSDSYPNELFVASPALPPCGRNTNSSRTWVDLFDQSGRRLFGFCAIGKPDALKSIWFVLDAEVIPPSWIYIEMNDRQTNTKYKSNLAETTL